MLDAPSAYNIANRLTIGLLDLGKGAIIPDKPLSLEHWLDSLGFASALTSISKTAKQAISLHGMAPSVWIPSQQVPLHGKGKGKTKGLNETKGAYDFTTKTIQHMNNPARSVPVQTLKDAISTGIALPDPQGTLATMYYTKIYKNGKQYNLEVLYDQTSDTIMHFKYTSEAIGPLPDIPK